MELKVSASEVQEKEQRVQRLLEQNSWNGLLLSGNRNFAWATCGRDNHVVKGSDGGVGHALFTADGGKYILCDNIEEPRLREEERLEEQGFKFVSGLWYQYNMAAEAAKLTGGLFAADLPVAGATLVSDRKLATALRYSLTPEEIERYKWLGQVAAEAMTTTAQAIEPGMTEFEVGAVLDHFLEDEGVTPYLTLVASDERIARYRHPIPTGKSVERYVMYVTCASAFGLIACATRLVSFGTLGNDLKRRHDAVCLVDTAFNLSTKIGATAADILAVGQEAYAAQGFGTEWTLHHQGGATGYAGRDYMAVPGIVETVQPNQAFAWNPSITGTKSEDTVIATEDGLLLLTTSEGWPTASFKTPLGVMERPLIWER